MGMNAKMKISTRKAAERIVQVLHEEEITFFLFDNAFNEAKDLANLYTTPYSPIELAAARLAHSTNKAKETEEAAE